MPRTSYGAQSRHDADLSVLCQQGWESFFKKKFDVDFKPAICVFEVGPGTQPVAVHFAENFQEIAELY